MDEGYDAVNLGRVRDLVAGRPLADLPPEAFELRSGRGRGSDRPRSMRWSRDRDHRVTAGGPSSVHVGDVALDRVPVGGDGSPPTMREAMVLGHPRRRGPAAPPALATRGMWDADQGHDMLVLRAFVRDGVVPLLGPPTSIGDVHHGAALLLPPVARGAA